MYVCIPDYEWIGNFIESLWFCPRIDNFKKYQYLNIMFANEQRVQQVNWTVWKVWPISNVLSCATYLPIFISMVAYWLNLNLKLRITMCNKKGHFCHHWWSGQWNAFVRCFAFRFVRIQMACFCKGRPYPTSWLGITVLLSSQQGRLYVVGGDRW